MQLQQQEVPTEEVAAPPGADDVAAPPPVAQSLGRLQLKRSFGAYAQEELSAAANTCGFVTTRTRWAYAEDCDKSGDKSGGSGKSEDSGTHSLPYIDVLKRTRVHSAVFRECSSTGRVTSAQVISSSSFSCYFLASCALVFLLHSVCSCAWCLVVETEQTARL